MQVNKEYFGEFIEPQTGIKFHVFKVEYYFQIVLNTLQSNYQIDDEPGCVSYVTHNKQIVRFDEQEQIWLLRTEHGELEVERCNS